MSESHFSLGKLHKYQQQKRRLAELETLRARADLDRRVQQLNDLHVRFDEVTAACHRDLAGESHLTRGHRDVLEHLRREIELARAGVDECMTRWQQSLAATTEESIKSESYETLRREEQAASEAAVQKAELVALSEIIMRQWARVEGETTDD